MAIDDDTHKSGTRREALGVVSFATRRFWLSTVTGHETESYDLTEISGPRFPVALTMSVGGC